MKKVNSFRQPQSSSSFLSGSGSQAQEMENLCDRLKKAKETLESTTFPGANSLEAMRVAEKLIQNDIELLLIKQKISELANDASELDKTRERILAIRTENQRLREALAKVT